MFDCIFIVIIYKLPVAIQSQRNLILQFQLQHQGFILPTTLSFPQGSKFIDDFPILALDDILSKN